MQNNINVRLSVILPVFNAAKYLAESIESILNQSFKDFEFIILNDNSEDQSLEIIKKYATIDNRIKIVNKEQNIGPALLRNEGIELSKGEFIALMDADDVANIKRFEKQISIFSVKSEIGVCGTWFEIFGNEIKNRVIEHPEFHEEIKSTLLYECCIGNPTVMIRKSVLDNCRYNPEMVPIEDYDFWTRLINNTKFYNIQESLLKYRWHDTNISKTKEENSKKMHRFVYLNQLKEFDLDKHNINLNYVLSAITFNKRMTSDEVYKIIEIKNFLIKKNQEIKKYDSILFEKRLNEISKITFTKAKNHNLKLYSYYMKHEKNNYRELSIFHKTKTLIKSLFMIRHN